MTVSNPRNNQLSLVLAIPTIPGWARSNLDNSFARVSAKLTQVRRQLFAALDGVLDDVEPLWSARHMKARVVAVRHETPTAKTFVLRPSIHWQGFRAGQNIAVSIEKEGVLHRRQYSLSCSPEYYRATGLICVTVKRVELGCVSGSLHELVRIGDILGISAAEGTFTLDAIDGIGPDVTRVVFIAAGSGITPMMSMLESRYQQQPHFKSSLIYCVRNAGDEIFRARLQALADAHPDFDLKTFYSDTNGHLTKGDLAVTCTGIAASNLFLCGPNGFRQMVLAHLDALGIDSTAVQQESFGLRAGDLPAAGSEASAGQVHFERSGRKVDSDGNTSLLVLAERAGLHPKYGCRSGNCHECTCQRGSGQLMDQRTGKLIDVSQQQIQACIAVPVGDLTMPAW